MDNHDFWMPKTLDDPPLFFMWDFDTSAIWIIFITLGSLLQMFWVGLGCAIVFGRGYSRLKEEGGKGLILKIMYWYLPSEYIFGKRLASHVREHIGG